MNYKAPAIEILMYSYRFSFSLPFPLSLPSPFPVHRLMVASPNIFNGDVPCWKIWSHPVPEFFMRRNTLSQNFASKYIICAGIFAENRPISWQNMCSFRHRTSILPGWDHFQHDFTTGKISMNFQRSIRLSWNFSS